MGSERRRPADVRPLDLEIGATAKADAIRFEKKPETEVRFRGDSIEQTQSGSRRENLPDEVESGVTYRNVRVGWRAAAWVENAVDENEKLEGGSMHSHTGGGGKDNP